MSVITSSPTLGEVFIAHRSQLCAIARRIVGIRELAEEIAQDAYLKIVEGAGAREVEKPFCYCCQVVRNLALDHCRRQTVESTYRVDTEDGEPPEVAGWPGPDQSLHERRVVDAIDKALATLPSRTRRVFELYRLAGLTQREIGRTLGCSATLVNFMLKDALNALAPCRELLDSA